MRKKKRTAVWFYPEIDEIDDVDAKQYHRASFSTHNSALNTSLRKPIRMQDFIQLCDSIVISGDLRNGQLRNEGLKTEIRDLQNCTDC